MFKASARRIRRTIANAALLVAACLTFAHPITQAQSQVRRVDDGMLRNAAATGDDWLTYGLDPGEKRYSPLTQIDATNVTRLQQGGRSTSLAARQSAGRRQPGSHAPGVERRALRHHDLERGLRGRRADRQAALEVGSRSQPAGRPIEDLLRRRQSRRGALSKARSSRRSSTAVWWRSTRRPASRCGKRAWSIRRTSTR